MLAKYKSLFVRGVKGVLRRVRSAIKLLVMWFAKPKVTVIICAYNVELYIKECVESVMKQSFLRCEIIVVDDGSKDKTAQIVKELARKDKRVKLLSQKNQGLSGARNSGFAMAKGDFVFFLDGDDYIPFDAIENLYSSVMKSGSDVAIGFYERVRANKIFPPRAAIVKMHQNPRCSVTPKEYPQVLENTTAWGKLMRVSLIKELNLQFITMLYEDQPFISKLYTSAPNGVDIIRQTTVFWRIRENESSITQDTHSLDNFKHKMKSITLALENVRKYDEQTYFARLFLYANWELILPIKNFPYTTDKQKYYDYMKQTIIPLIDTLPKEYYAKLKPAFALTYYLLKNDLKEIFEQFMLNVLYDAYHIVDGKILYDLKKVNPDIYNALPDKNILKDLVMPDELVMPYGKVQTSLWDKQDVLNIYGWLFLSNIDPEVFEYEYQASLKINDKVIKCQVESMQNEQIAREDQSHYIDFRKCGLHIKATEVPKTNIWATLQLKCSVRPKQGSDNVKDDNFDTLTNLSFERSLDLPVFIHEKPDQQFVPNFAQIENITQVEDLKVGVQLSKGKTDIKEVYIIIEGAKINAKQICQVDENGHFDFELKANYPGYPATVLPFIEPFTKTTYKISVLVKDANNQDGYRKLELSPYIRDRQFDLIEDKYCLDAALQFYDNKIMLHLFRKADGPYQYRSTLRDYLFDKPKPVEPKTVLFRTFYGEKCNDSARAMHYDLLKRGGWKLYWTVIDFSVEVPQGGIPVISYSADWHEKLSTCEYIVDNVHQIPEFIKRDGQKVIQTYHGYPFKLMGKRFYEEANFPLWRRESFALREKQWDYVLSPAPYATKFYLDCGVNTTKEKIVEQGYPRNDIFHQSEKADVISVSTRKAFNISDDKKVILYAPTYRDYLATSELKAKPNNLIENYDNFMKQLGEEYVLFIREHGAIARNQEVNLVNELFNASRQQKTPQIIDVTNYPDIDNLVLASDMAILDYSSLRFDYVQTGKPCVFYVPDEELYFANRTNLLDFALTAPGPKAVSESELIDCIKNILPKYSEVFAESREKFIRDFMPLDDGNAAKRVNDIIFDAKG